MSADLTGPIIFESLEPVTVQVFLEKKPYVLLQATGDTASKFRTKSAKCYRLGAEGELGGIDGIGELEPYLVSLSLAYADETQPSKAQRHKNTNLPKLVPIELIKSWPSEVQTALFNRIKAISPGLEEKRETTDSLKKRIKEDQKKLAKLEKGQATEEEEAEKNLSNLMTSTFD